MFYYALLFAAAFVAEGATISDGMKWIDGRELPIEGRAFDNTEHYYDRLPSNVTTSVNSGVRSEGWTNLVRLLKDGMYSGDYEGTVDGTHANNLGMRSLAKAYGRAVKVATANASKNGLDE